MREGKMCLKLLQEHLDKVKKKNRNNREAGGGNKRQNKVEVKGMVSEKVFKT